MKSFIALLVSATAIFAYPGEQEKEPDKVPPVETWKVSDVTPPKYNYRDVRLSKTGTALKKDDPREPVLDTTFYEDPNHPGEFGAIYRAKNTKGEWVIFAKLWGMKKVDGQWEQDIDKDKNGRPDDNGHLTIAILARDGQWHAGPEGITNFSWEIVWRDSEEKDYVEEIKYAIAGKDDNDPSGLFLYTGRITVVEPEPEEEPEDDE